MSTIRRYPVVAFFVLAFVLAWVLVPFGDFGAFAPLVSALVVIPIVQGRTGLRELGARFVRWRVRWYWWALAIALPVAVHAAAVLVSLPFSGPDVAVSSFGTVLAMFALRLVNPLDGPLGEEPGWRGFALPGLQDRLAPGPATAVLAVVVTIWHLPLVFLADGGFEPALLVAVVVGTVGATFWYSWLFNHTGGSVLLVLVAHSAEGAVQDHSVIYASVWFAVAVALVVVDRAHWFGSAPDPARRTAPTS